MVEIIHHADASELIALAGACLEAHESENNLLLGLAYALAEDPLRYGSEPPLLLSVLEQGSAIGAAVMTPPRRIILSKFVANGAIAHLVHHLLATDTSIPGVVGPAAAAQAFAACWAEAVPSAAPKKTMRMRVFEARTVADVPLAAGGAALGQHGRPSAHGAVDGRLFARGVRGASRSRRSQEKRRAIHRRQTTVHLGLQWAGLYCQNDAPDAKRHIRHRGVHAARAAQQGILHFMRRVADQKTALQALFVLQPICRSIQSNLQQHL